MDELTLVEQDVSDRFIVDNGMGFFGAVKRPVRRLPHKGGKLVVVAPDKPLPKLPSNAAAKQKHAKLSAVVPKAAATAKALMAKLQRKNPKRAAQLKAKFASRPKHAVKRPGMKGCCSALSSFGDDFFADPSLSTDPYADPNAYADPSSDVFVDPSIMDTSLAADTFTMPDIPVPTPPKGYDNRKAKGRLNAKDQQYEMFLALAGALQAIGQEIGNLEAQLSDYQSQISDISAALREPAPTSVDPYGGGVQIDPNTGLPYGFGGGVPPDQVGPTGYPMSVDPYQQPYTGYPTQYPSPTPPGQYSPCVPGSSQDPYGNCIPSPGYGQPAPLPYDPYGQQQAQYNPYPSYGQSYLPSGPYAAYGSQPYIDAIPAGYESDVSQNEGIYGFSGLGAQTAGIPNWLLIGGAALLVVMLGKKRK